MRELYRRIQHSCILCRVLNFWKFSSQTLSVLVTSKCIISLLFTSEYWCNEILQCISFIYQKIILDYRMIHLKVNFKVD